MAGAVIAIAGPVAVEIGNKNILICNDKD